MRGTVKGGVWKNTEDEILKVAVMKYGKNQWARISSLLVRKTPKQCKARWYEWIDPSIKKTEWSREEEEKLLHLAKVMPTQWRTIAPIVGRTAAQCLEHYEQLLDAAQEKAAGGESGNGSSEMAVSVLDDPRRLRPGEIDTTPETKPARPDPVDMDEDEKEMLSEARARLANTQGKKAKRKAREKQLEEARRLASLQKRRELKAAGIFARGPRIKGMNYNVDIPFERKPPPGFFDTTAELQREKEEKMSGSRIRPKFEKRRVDLESDERRRDIRKQREANRASPSVADMARLKQMTEEKFSKKLGGKLSLPAPTLSDHEVEQFVKLGLSSEEARMMMLEGATPASSSLVSDYQPTPLRTPAAQTPRSVLGTPFREQGSVSSAGRAAEQHRHATLQRQLELGFAKLPLPKNDFDIVVPELVASDETFAECGKGDRSEDFTLDRSLFEHAAQPSSDLVEDAMDRDLRVERQRLANEASKLKRMPLAAQRGLSLPRSFSSRSATALSAQGGRHASHARSLVQSEMIVLLEQQQQASRSSLSLDMYPSCSDKDIQRIHSMIDREREASSSFSSGDLLGMIQWSQRHSDLWTSVYDAPEHVAELPVELMSHRQIEAGLVDPRSLVQFGHEERIGALRSEFHFYREQMAAQAANAKSMESSVTASLAPLAHQSAELAAKIAELGEQMEKARTRTVMTALRASAELVFSNLAQ